MGGIVTMGRLIMAFGDMPKGSWESVGARGSGCEGLDDSPEPEFLTLLARVWNTELSGREVVIVGGLLVSYLHWGELEGTPPSKGGMDEALGPEMLNPAERRLSTLDYESMKNRYELLLSVPCWK